MISISEAQSRQLRVPQSLENKINSFELSRVCVYSAYQRTHLQCTRNSYYYQNQNCDIVHAF